MIKYFIATMVIFTFTACNTLNTVTGGTVLTESLEKDFAQTCEIVNASQFDIQDVIDASKQICAFGLSRSFSTDDIRNISNQCAIIRDKSTNEDIFTSIEYIEHCSPRLTQLEEDMLRFSTLSEQFFFLKT